MAEAPLTTTTRRRSGWIVVAIRTVSRRFSSETTPVALGTGEEPGLELNTSGTPGKRSSR